MFPTQQFYINIIIFLSIITICNTIIQDFVFSLSRVLPNFKQHIISEAVVRKCFSKHLRGSEKFRKFHRKTPVLESIFNKVADLKTFSTQVFSSEICEFFLQNNSGGCFCILRNNFHWFLPNATHALQKTIQMKLNCKKHIYFHLVLMEETWFYQRLFLEGLISIIKDKKISIKKG